MNKKIIVLTGPTASGKTKTAIKLAKKINASIICADSRIVYKDFDVVSAKPNEIEKEGVIHHLIDILLPYQNFSAGDFVKLSNEIIEKAFSKNENIIISGGTWFYIKSLLDEACLPKVSINKELREELTKLDNKTLWEKLYKLDFKRANEIHINNKDKIIRSIEMCVELNQPISSYKREENKRFDALWFMHDLLREELYNRINKRVDVMLENGLYEEYLKNKEKYPNSKIMENTIGYKEFFDLENNIYTTKQEAIEKIKQHTRNFAKRQLTYFRQNKDIKFIKDEDDIIKEIKNV